MDQALLDRLHAERVAADDLRDRLYSERLDDLGRDPLTAQLHEALTKRAWTESGRNHVERLLKAGANPNGFDPYDGRSLLHMILDTTTDLAMIRLLAKHGASLDFRSDETKPYPYPTDTRTAREFIASREVPGASKRRKAVFHAYQEDILNAYEEGKNDALREAAELAELIALADAAMVAQEPPRARKRL